MGGGGVEWGSVALRLYDENKLSLVPIVSDGNAYSYGNYNMIFKTVVWELERPMVHIISQSIVEILKHIRRWHSE